MDVASSAVSLIQFTVKGLQIIHKTFASIKEAPDTVTYVGKHAGNLLHILQRLETSPVVLQSHDTRLAETMRTCSADVTRMAQKLAEVGFTTGDKVRTRLWRSAKSVVNEKEWKEFQARLHQYSDSLTTFVIVEDSDKLFHMSRELSRKIDDGHVSVHERLIDLSAKCDGIETKYASIEAMAHSSQVHTAVDSIRNDIRDQLRQLVTEERASQQKADDKKDERRAPDNGNVPVHASAIDSNTARGIVEDIERLVDRVNGLVAQVAILEINDASQRYPTPREPSNSALPSPPTSQLGASTATGEELREMVRVSQNFPNCPLRTLGSKTFMPAMVNRRCLARLLTWSKTASTTLWLRGGYMPYRGGANPLTRIGMKLVAFGEQANLRMVTYFANFETPKWLGLGEPAEAKFVRSVLYALIRQMVELLPDQFEGNIDISQRRIRRLDGTEASWEEALTMLDDLIRVLPHPVFCVLDGVQCLEHAGTEQYLRRLIDILRKSDLNVLYLTTGTCRSLRDAIPLKEMVTEEDLRSGGQEEDLERHCQEFWK